MSENERAQSFDPLKLQNQLCFPLYAVTNQILRMYRPLLDKLNLTYTQYLAMMVLWDEKQVNETRLCEALRLQTNTVTPLLQKLIQKGYVRKEKDPSDERNRIITLTGKGCALREQALSVPQTVSCDMRRVLTEEEAATLYRLLYRILDCADEPSAQTEMKKNNR